MKVTIERCDKCGNYHPVEVKDEPPTEELCPCCGNPRKCEPRKPREWWLTRFSETKFFVTCDPALNPDAFRVREVIE